MWYNESRRTFRSTLGAISNFWDDLFIASTSDLIAIKAEELLTGEKQLIIEWIEVKLDAGLISMQRILTLAVK